MTLKLPLSLVAATLILPHLHAQTTGTAHPEALDDNIVSSDPAPQPQHYVKPSPSVPLANNAATSSAPALNARSEEVYGPYIPYNGGKPSTPNSTAASTFTVTDDPTSGVVMDVPTGPNELPIGTLLKSALQVRISTKITPAGTAFTATLSDDVTHKGRVLLPAGTIVRGRITQIHGGRRISGASAIRLRPDTVTLPDGATYRVDAEVTDLDHFHDSHVNSEGTIVSNSHGKTAGIIVGATTGTAVVAGAMLGGGVGAVVGLGVGAGIGTIVWLKQDHQQTLEPGTQIVFALNAPLYVTPTAH